MRAHAWHLIAACCALPALAAAATRPAPAGQRSASRRLVAATRVPQPGEVTSGVRAAHDGWLFLEDPPSRSSAAHAPLFGASELARWARTMEAWRTTAAAVGAEFVVLLPPDKHTIYPQRYPGPASPATPSRLDQLVATLTTQTSVRVVDARPLLRAHATLEEVYAPTDSHWNDVGAFLAYRLLAEALAPALPELAPIAWSEVQRSSGPPRAGDLSQIGHFVDPMFPVPLVALPPALQPVLTYTVLGRVAAGISAAHMASERPEAPLAQVVGFHDSFFYGPLPYLAAHFRRGDFWLGHRLDAAIIARLRPQVVVYEVVERFLYYEEPPPLPR